MVTHKEAIECFKKLVEYCEEKRCFRCVFNSGTRNNKSEYGCGLVAGLSDHRRFKTVLSRAEKKMERE